MKPSNQQWSDPLAEFQPRQSSPRLDPRTVLRLAAAVALLAAGISLCIWMAATINATIRGADAPTIVRHIAPLDPDALSITLPSGGKVRLPSATMSVVAYIAILILMAISARVALSLIRGGIEMLRPDPPAPPPDA